MDANQIRVASIDDHDLMRGGIRFTLKAFDDLLMVGDIRRGEEAVEMCQNLQPDVVLVDMKMQGQDGVATTKAIKASCPNVQVLILSSFHDADLVRRAMKAGAIGYLLKDSDKDELALAIRGANEGKVTLSPQVTHDLIDQKSTPVIDLTDRERDVLELLVQGLSNKQIADRLHRSPFTVRHHVSQLIKRLGAANRAEVAAIAVQRKLV